MYIINCSLWTRPLFPGIPWVSIFLPPVEYQGKEVPHVRREAKLKWMSKSIFNKGLYQYDVIFLQPVDYYFPRKMMSEKQAEKFHTNNSSLSISGWCF